MVQRTGMARFFFVTGASGGRVAVGAIFHKILRSSKFWEAVTLAGEADNL